jgi:hypothetical protein
VIFLWARIEGSLAGFSKAVKELSEPPARPGGLHIVFATKAKTNLKATRLRQWF